MVGDYIDRFVENDLVFLGSYLPHEWLCDPEFFGGEKAFSGEGLVIQFQKDFLGEKFFNVPENFLVNKLLVESSRGIEILGKSKKKIFSLMMSMCQMDYHNRLYTLFEIFRILSKTQEKKILLSPSYTLPMILDYNDPMQKALKFILQNFQNQIQLKDLLDLTNMSNTPFYAAFKNAYMMSFKDYLLNVRVGYACKLLTHSSMNISEIAYECGFENLSNFNRQFKKIKSMTPSKFQEQVETLHKKIEE
jgi:AraC-like DNA-binding protein